MIHDLDRHLAGWAFAGQESDRPGNGRVLFQDEAGRWYAFSLGPRHVSGAVTAITIVGSGKKGFLDNRLRGMQNVVRNGGE